MRKINEEEHRQKLQRSLSSANMVPAGYKEGHMDKIFAAAYIRSFFWYFNAKLFNTGRGLEIPRSMACPVNGQLWQRSAKSRSFNIYCCNDPEDSDDIKDDLEVGFSLRPSACDSTMTLDKYQDNHPKIHLLEQKLFFERCEEIEIGDSNDA
ncbi:hypothetical protein V1477_013412 [Vespula maculifrons]|uniref:Uncharacterized protein n=1 Tax=Vespula maculifrons TaxID=7453 RepID=A0ABD2BQG3_VESMC